MSIMRATMLLALSSLLTGCAATQQMTTDEIAKSGFAVDYAFDEDTDFDKYKTWSWIPAPIPSSGYERLDDPEWRETIDIAVQQEMFARGYRMDRNSPDLLVNALATVEKIGKKEIEDNFDGYYHPEYHAHLPEGKRSAKRKWDEGTLMIFIFDAATKEIVWYGTVRTEVYRWSDKATAERRSKEAVRLLLESLPSRSRLD